MALAWGNKTFFPKDYSTFVDKSHTLVESGVLEMIDPELLNNRVKRKSTFHVSMNKLGRFFKTAARKVSMPVARSGTEQRLELKSPGRRNASAEDDNEELFAPEIEGEFEKSGTKLSALVERE